MSGRYRVYDPIASYYQRYWGDAFLRDARRGFENLLLPHLRPGARILDLCCGAGGFAAWLTGLGFDVTGLDGSEALLALARENAPQAKFTLADAREFSLPGKFDAVISTFDSLNHIASAEELEQVFANVRETLAEDGLFFFDMNLAEGFLSAIEESYAAVEDHHVCVVKSDYDSKDGLARSRITLFELDDGAWQRRDVEILEYCYTIRQIGQCLRAAGLARPRRFEARRDLGMPRGEGRVFFLTRKSKRRKSKKRRFASDEAGAD